MKKYFVGIALAGGLSVAAQAATVNVGFTGGAGAATLPAGSSLVQTFDGLASGSSLGPNASVYSNSVQDVAARPAFGSTGNFGAVRSGGSFLFTLAQASSSFSFVLGSLDTFNSVRIGFNDGTFQTLMGGAIKNDANFDSGNQTIADTNGRVLFSSNGAKISNLQFGSTGNSFEFDNFAVGGNAVPEPAAWALMLSGFGIAGSAMRRRRNAGRITYA